jgi:RNA polymerase sigma-70 factor (ECF subfamily)
MVNGAVGAIVRTPAGPVAVAGLTIVQGRIAAIDIIADPAKLAGVRID